MCQRERLGRVDVHEVVWEATSKHQRLAQIDEILGANKRPYQSHWERKHVGARGFTWVCGLQVCAPQVNLVRPLLQAVALISFFYMCM